MHLIGPNVGDHIYILRLTRHAVQRAGDRASYIVRDAEAIERLDQRGEGLDHIVVQ